MNKYFGPLSFYKRAILIAIPVMLQQLIQSLVNLIDNFMVSGLGDIKMGGVNIAGQILFIFIVLLSTICASGGIYMTQHFGANNKAGMKQAMSFKLILGGVAITLYLIICLIIPEQILKLLLIGNSEAEAILFEGVRYMRIMALAGIPMCLSTVIASSLKDIGKVNPSLVITIIATAFNALLNYMLIYGNFGLPRLEVEGAAIATVIARCFEMLMFLIYMAKNEQPFAIKVEDLINIDWTMFKDMLKKASMVIFSEMLWVISETVATALYNGKGGAEVVSGMSSSFTIADLFFVSFNGTNAAVAVIIGQTLGKGELEKAKQQKTWLFTAAIIFGFIMMGVALSNVALVSIFFGKLSSEAQEICRGMIFVNAMYMPLWVYQNVQFVLSRAGGDTKMGFLVDGIFTTGMYFPLMFIIALCTDIGPVYMYAIIKLVDVPKVLFANWWLKKEKWVRNLAV